MDKKITTVLVVVKDGEVLLGMKKRGFGEGKWNGFGGKLMPGESIEAAATRETQEECGILVKNIKKVGILDFEFALKREWDQQVHFFVAQDFEGTLKESGEMKPGWFIFAEIPYATMWPDDKFWMPMVLEGKNFSGKFVFGDNNDILSHTIKEVESL